MGLKERSGQMTIEFAVAFPVMLTIALIAVNALMLFADCASFDRAAREAIRLCATSPEFGQTVDQTTAQVKTLIEEHVDTSRFAVSVGAYSSGGRTVYVATLEFTPTLFGARLRESIFGIDLPTVEHSVSLAVDPYHPGVVV